MSSSLNFTEFVVEQMEGAGFITFAKMFGEYGIYCDGKIVALVCDDQLFVKPTNSGRAYIREVVEAQPYPGAKMYFLIEDKIEDAEWLAGLIEVTAAELPEPKRRRK